MAISPALMGALMVLTFSTGIVDAVSYLGLGRIFTANMTGNIVFIGFSLSGESSLRLQGQGAALISFALGALLSGRFGKRASGWTQRDWLVRTALVEAVLLLAAVGVSPQFAEGLDAYSLRVFGVIMLTAAAMGWRTAAVRKLAVADMLTTVLTLSLTGLAAESSLAGGENPRMPRRLLSLVLMFAGAITGALLLKWGLAVPLAATGLCALAAAALFSRGPVQQEVSA